VSSAGQEAVELAASAGLVLDPWEAAALEDGLGERANGKWAAFEVGLIVPRQNGKGAVLEARELAGLYLFGDDLILHSAHEFKTAAEAFRRVWSLIRNTPDLDRRVMRVRTSHGDEGIELKGGQRLRFVARSTGSGRGFSGDTVILDEAYNLSAKATSALIPTMSARPNPQLWYTSSAPLDGPESDVLRRLCKRGRAGESSSLAYLEYCATNDANLNDPEVWADANPGFGVRITEEFIGFERAALEPDDFARERLGIWFEDQLGAQVIPAAAWAACEDPKSGPVGEVKFSLDVAPERTASAIGVAGASGRRGSHIEVVEHLPGVSWVVARAKELQEAWGGLFAIAEGSPAWSLEPELTAVGVKVLPVKVSEHVQACGQLYDAVIEHEVRHLGQSELNKALSGADRRPYGDAWVWSRKNSSTDISPLVAVTLALWAHSKPAEAVIATGFIDPNDEE
jgi:phage terminase large subunit-like protein